MNGKNRITFESEAEKAGYRKGGGLLVELLAVTPKAHRAD